MKFNILKNYTPTAYKSENELFLIYTDWCGKFAIGFNHNENGIYMIGKNYSLTGFVGEEILLDTFEEAVKHCERYEKIMCLK